MSPARTGRRLLVVAIVLLVGLAAAGGVVSKKRWDRYHRPFVTIEAQTKKVHALDFLDEDTLVELGLEEVRVYKLDAGVATITSRFQAPWVEQHDAWKVEPHHLVTLARDDMWLDVWSTLGVHEAGLAEAVAIGMDLTSVAVSASYVAVACSNKDASKSVSGGGLVRQHTLEVWARGTNSRVKKLDVRPETVAGVGSDYPAYPQDLGVALEEGRLHVLRSASWSVLSLPDAQPLRQLSIPSWYDSAGLSGTGELLLGRYGDTVAVSPRDGGIRTIDPHADISYPLARTGERFVALTHASRGPETYDFHVIDIATGLEVVRVPVEVAPNRFPELATPAFSPSGERLAFTSNGRILVQQLPP